MLLDPIAALVLGPKGLQITTKDNAQHPLPGRPTD